MSGGAHGTDEHDPDHRYVPHPTFDELDMSLRDSATTGRSCAADRALRLAKAALRGLSDDLRTEVTS